MVNFIGDRCVDVLCLDYLIDRFRGIDALRHFPQCIEYLLQRFVLRQSQSDALVS